MLEAKAKDQGHKAQVLSKKKKKKRSSQKFFRRSPKKKKKKKKKRSSQKFFKRSPRKNPFQKIFQPLHKILTFQKIVLSSSRGQANFRGLEASRPRPRPRTSKFVLEDVLEDSTSVTYKSIKGIYIKQNLLDTGTGMTGKTMDHSKCIIVSYSKTPNCFNDHFNYDYQK